VGETGTGLERFLCARQRLKTTRPQDSPRTIAGAPTEPGQAPRRRQPRQPQPSAAGYGGIALVPRFSSMLVPNLGLGRGLGETRLRTRPPDPAAGTRNGVSRNRLPKPRLGTRRKEGAQLQKLQEGGGSGGSPRYVLPVHGHSRYHTLVYTDVQSNQAGVFHRTSVRARQSTSEALGATWFSAHGATFASERTGCRIWSGPGGKQRCWSLRPPSPRRRGDNIWRRPHGGWRRRDRGHRW